MPPEAPSGSVLTAETLMARLSEHLKGLAAEVQQVEQVVGSTALRAQLSSQDAIVQLQSLDYLRQSLEDLTVLTMLLARSDEAGVSALQDPVQIRGRMRLGSTKALFDAPLSGHALTTLNKAGNVDLF